MELFDVFTDQLSKFLHALALTEAKDRVHNLKGNEKWSEQGECKISLDRRGSFLKNAMADKLGQPAQDVNETHEAELGHSKVEFMAVSQPLDIAKDHDWPPPEYYGAGNLPVDKEVGGTDNKIQVESTSNLISEEGYFESDVNGRPKFTLLDVPCV